MSPIPIGEKGRGQLSSHKTVSLWTISFLGRSEVQELGMDSRFFPRPLCWLDADFNPVGNWVVRSGSQFSKIFVISTSPLKFMEEIIYLFSSKRLMNLYITEFKMRKVVSPHTVPNLTPGFFLYHFRSLTLVQTFIRTISTLISPIPGWPRLTRGLGYTDHRYVLLCLCVLLVVYLYLVTSLRRCSVPYGPRWSSFLSPYLV